MDHNRLIPFNLCAFSSILVKHGSVLDSFWTTANGSRLHFVASANARICSFQPFLIAHSLVVYSFAHNRFSSTSTPKLMGFLASRSPTMSWRWNEEQLYETDVCYLFLVLHSLSWFLSSDSGNLITIWCSVYWTCANDAPKLRGSYWSSGLRLCGVESSQIPFHSRASVRCAWSRMER